MERPILFSGPMVRAILDGRKTQTRRVLKPVGDKDRVFQMDDGSWHVTDSKGGHMSQVTIPYPVGTELWVREAWTPLGELSECTGPEDILYRATATEAGKATTNWRPSIHMPRWASRITLRVTAVKVERLQDISEADCYAEGCEQDDADGIPVWYVRGTGLLPHPNTGPKCYRLLWESINGPGSWDANPWVVAYSFERVLPK